MKEYLKKVLNPSQYEAATYVDWPSLILAGAGAGKTRTLTYKIAYINSLWVSDENILAVTFTNKAANEMKERLLEISEEISKWKVSTGCQDTIGYQDKKDSAILPEFWNPVWILQSCLNPAILI